jgi:hypothetical protein
MILKDIIGVKNLKKEKDTMQKNFIERALIYGNLRDEI